MCGLYSERTNYAIVIVGIDTPKYGETLRDTLCHWLENGGLNTLIDEFSEKRSLIPLGFRVPIWEMSFCLGFYFILCLHGAGKHCKCCHIVGSVV